MGEIDAPAATPASVGEPGPVPGAARDDGEWAETFRSMATTTVLVGAFLIVLSTVQPRLLFLDNTPTGGDMGAHVWGPAYLRDHLLPNWSLSGWSMDFYSGLPMYRFYMVVPAVFIVLLDLVLPYGIAFKLVSVAGLLALPACAWAMGRLARLPYAMPELLAVGSLALLFDETYTIYGGNITSTMAGEFSFSISLAFAVVAFGLFARGLEDGRHRGWAALAIAMSALCHGIVLLFVFGGVALMWLMRMDRQRFRYGITTLLASVLLSAFWVFPFLGGHSFMSDMKYEPRPSGVNDTLWSMYFQHSPLMDTAIFLAAAAGFAGAIVHRRFLGIWMGFYALILAAMVKVAQNSLPVIGLLWNPRVLPFFYLLRYFLSFLGIYEIALFVKRYIGLERQLRRPDETGTPAAASVIGWRGSLAVVGAASVLMLVVLGFRYQALPGGRVSTDSAGQSSYSWGPLSASANRGFSDGWARWNFTGYEGKAAYGEYHGIVTTMKELGEDPEHGCGRALWENNGQLNKYGTTMALMLLPFWTDGCIPSMEGLYFEASGTTPYHFIAAAAMSRQSSNPVRELRYDDNDASLGVGYLRQLGVRYFMAFTPEAIAEADARPELLHVASSGPWKVYEVTGMSLVEGLRTRPVVVNPRGGDQRERWLEVGTSYFQRTGDWDMVPVADGPEEWERIDLEVDLAERIGEPGSSGRKVDIVRPATEPAVIGLPEVTVSDLVMTDDSVSFEVDRVGVPVVVRVSYFPNWKAHGADGPYRAAPNMMVVVPTSNEVTLRYTTGFVDRFSWLLTFAGIAMLVRFFRRPFRYGASLSEIDARR